MRSLFSVFVVLAATAICTRSTAAEAGKLNTATQDALAKIAAKTRSVKTFTAEASSRIDSGHSVQTTKHKLTVELPDKLRASLGDQATGEGLLVSNGKVFWMVSPAAVGVILRVDVEKVNAAIKNTGAPSPLNMSDDLTNPLATLRAGTAQLTGIEKTEGVEYWVFKGTPIEDRFLGSPTAKVYVSTVDGLVRKVICLDPQGRAVETTTYDKIEVNPKVDAAIFEYTPPSGGEVKDGTQFMIDQALKANQKQPANETGKPPAR